MTPFLFGQKLASQPSFWSDYTHQLNKFYNPWSDAWNEPAGDGIEKGLQYAGRGAMGVGAGAAALAGGIAAAPAVAGAGNAAAGAIGTGAAAVGSQAAKLPNMAANVANSASQFMSRHPYVAEQITRNLSTDPARMASSFNNPVQSVNTAKNTVANTYNTFGMFR